MQAEFVTALLTHAAFATAILAALVALHLARQEGGGRPWPNRLLASYFLVFGLQQFFLSLQLILEGARFGPVRVALMLIGNALVFLFFEALRSRGSFRIRPAYTLHAVPVVLVPIVVRLGGADLLDALLSLSLFAYALWFLWLARKGAAAFAHLQTFAATAQRWLLAFAGFFLFSAVMDQVIARQIAVGGAIVSSSALVLVVPGLLLFLGFLLFGAMGTRSLFDWLVEQALPRATPRESQVPEGLAARIESEISKAKIYGDASLTVSRFARRLGVPARAVSVAVNDELGLTFSQLLSRTRIDAAKSLLCAPEGARLTVLDVAYQVGFGSKSNFNKEFKRLTGMTPSAFRAGPDQSTNDTP